MKKIIVGLIALLMSVAVFAGCGASGNNKPSGTDTDKNQPSGGGDEEKEPPEEKDWLEALSAETRSNLSADGYVLNNISDFSQYVGTSAYRTVATADELIAALKDAKYDYTTTWDKEENTFKQTLKTEGKVHVIEITADLNLGYYKLSEEAKKSGIVEDFCAKNATQLKTFTMSDMFKENGISKIKVERTNNLLVYSKNGAKLTHAGFSLLSDTNVVFRNLELDEIWQWEDSASATAPAVGDCDAFGWAYFKVSHCGYIWIDHCTFGKSYDGQIDYSNPVSYDEQTAPMRAPYGYDGKNGLHISWCKFNAGSDDKDGYLYKMMQSVEEDYQNGGGNYLYYKALRDGGISFEDILYGIAIPQKKGFLCGDSGNNKSEYDYNYYLNVSFSNCIFKNLEDRIPKLRGGNAVMYNCVVDCLEYIQYRNKLRAKGAAGLVAKVNSGWKCALVSQGIVCGNGGSFYAENCAFRGIETLIKHNDKGGTTEQIKDGEGNVIDTIVRPADGGYKLINCSNKASATASERVGSTTDENCRLPGSSNASLLNTANFKWHTADGEQPFAISAFELKTLEKTLTAADYGVGVNTKLQERLLKVKY